MNDGRNRHKIRNCLHSISLWFKGGVGNLASEFCEGGTEYFDWRRNSRDHRCTIRLTYMTVLGFLVFCIFFRLGGFRNNIADREIIKCTCSGERLLPSVVATEEGSCCIRAISDTFFVKSNVSRSANGNGSRGYTKGGYEPQ